MLTIQRSPATGATPAIGVPDKAKVVVAAVRRSVETLPAGSTARVAVNVAPPASDSPSVVPPPAAVAAKRRALGSSEAPIASRSPAAIDASVSPVRTV